MSLDEKWDEFFVVTAISDTNQIALLDLSAPLDDQNQIITALNAKSYFQTPLVGDVNASGNQITALGGINFDDVNTGIAQSVNDLLYDVGIGGTHNLRVDNVVEYSFNNLQADFNGNNLLNAPHDHSNVAGGGQLLSTSALSDTDDLAYLNTPNIYDAGAKQSFVADATTAGININAQLPSTLAVGDIYRTAEVLHFIGTSATDFALATTNATLAQFASTTSLELRGVISDETGDGLLVFNVNPTLDAPFISDFTNADHDHSEIGDGGQLNALTALDATGTKDSTTFLRGDNTWDVPPDLQGITSINADSTAAQFIAAGTNLDLLDAGATHTISLQSSINLDAITVNTIQAIETYTFSDGSTQSQAALPDGISGSIETLEFVQSVSFSAQDPITAGVFITNDGKKLYSFGVTVPASVYEFNLTTPFDISTRSFVQSKDISAQTTSPNDIFVRADGLKMYVLENSNIFEYDITTAFDITTATFLQSVFSLLVTANGITFRPDGKKMYLSDSTSDVISEFDLTTPWSIITRTLFQTFAIGGDFNPQDVCFRADGKKMYVPTTIDDLIREYDVSIPWDISTAVLVDTISTVPQDTTPLGLIINPQATKFYLYGSQNFLLYEFDLGINVNSIFTGTIHQVGGNYLLEPTNPIIAGTVSQSELAQSFAVTVSGNYAYVGSSTGFNFNVIDITEPTNPVLVGTLSRPTEFNTIRDIAIAGDFAYVINFVRDSLAIIDITNPSNPIFVSEIVGGALINAPSAVYVVGQYAYVSTANNNALVIIDISDSNNPTILTVFTDPDLKRASDLYVQGNYAYVGAFDGVTGGIVIIDISNPNSPFVSASIINQSVLNGIKRIDVSGRYVYAVSSVANSFTIWDVKDPTATPILVGSNTTEPLLDGAIDVTVSGKYAYIVAQDDDALTTWDVSDPTNPTKVGEVVDGTDLNEPQRVVMAGKFAYVATRSGDSLSIIDISGIDAPSATIGNVEAGYLSVTDSAVIDGNLYANSLNAGIGGIAINGIPVSLQGNLTTEVRSPSSLPAPVAGVITLPTGTYIFKNSMTFTDRIEIPSGATVNMYSVDGFNIDITYTGTGTFITALGGSGTVGIQIIDFILTNDNVTFANITSGSLFMRQVGIDCTSSNAGTRKMGTFTTTVTQLFSETAWINFNAGATIDAANLRVLNTLIVTDIVNPGSTRIFDVTALSTNASFSFDDFVLLSGSESLMGFADTITTPIVISDCPLSGISTNYYASGAFLDSTSPNIISRNNSGSPDSMTTGEFDFLNVATPQLVTITTIDVPVAIAGGAWTNANLERMTADVGNNGIATITALGTHRYTVAFSANLEKLLGGTTNIALTILVNGVDVTTNPPRSLNSGIVQIGDTKIFSLTTGDTVQAACLNSIDTDNIEVSQSSLSITRGG